jgi:hypothetical protein
MIAAIFSSISVIIQKLNVGAYLQVRPEGEEN